MKKLNNLFEEAKKLNELIKNSAEYLEYKSYSNLKNNSEELKILQEKLEIEKNKVCLKNENRQEDTNYYAIKEEIDNHPIMVNYQSAYKKFQDYLYQITSVINQDL